METSHFYSEKWSFPPKLHHHFQTIIAIQHASSVNMVRNEWGMFGTCRPDGAPGKIGITCL